MEKIGLPNKIYGPNKIFILTCWQKGKAGFEHF